MPCRCRCHSYGAGTHVTCDVDTGSSGSSTMSCSPCDGGQPARRTRSRVTTGPLCRRCNAPTDGFLCQTCADQLVELILWMPRNLGHLVETVSRQDRIDVAIVIGRPFVVPPGLAGRLPIAWLRSTQGQITLPATALPINIDAAVTLSASRNTIVTWARHLAEQRGLELATMTAEQVCGWLVTNIGSIRMDEAAAEFYEAFKATHDLIAWTIDRQDPDVYAGRCDSPDVHFDALPVIGPLCNPFVCSHPSCELIRAKLTVLTPRTATCGADLYGHIGDKTIDCPTCGAVYQVESRKAQMLAGVLDQIAPTAIIANALTGLLRPVTPSVVRNMAARGQIMDHGPAPDGKSRLYRVGDVVDVLHAREEREQRRRA